MLHCSRGRGHVICFNPIWLLPDLSGNRRLAIYVQQRYVPSRHHVSCRSKDGETMRRDMPAQRLNARTPINSNSWFVASSLLGCYTIKVSLDDFLSTDTIGIKTPLSTQELTANSSIYLPDTMKPSAFVFSLSACVAAYPHYATLSYSSRSSLQSNVSCNGTLFPQHFMWEPPRQGDRECLQS